MSVIIKKFKPTSPGVRQRKDVKYVGLSKEGPRRELLESKKRGSGRGSNGRITVRHKGGGHKQHYRLIDFKRSQHDGVVGQVKAIEYDPNRSAYIALISYANGAWSYIIAPAGVEAGDQIMSGSSSEIKAGNAMELAHIPVGTVIHCVELKPGAGAKFIRSAGASATLSGFEGKYAILRMRSGETRKVLSSCRATIGTVSNSAHSLKSKGKAGRSRWVGIRPTVRGVAMNPVDHPMGGGEGRTSGGRHPCSPTGLLSKGKRTRKSRNPLVVRYCNETK